VGFGRTSWQGRVKSLEKRFPQLEIYRDPPEWMTAADIDQIKEKMTIDIDDESNPILASLRQTSEE
jgi:hypothetical protein